MGPSSNYVFEAVAPVIPLQIGETTYSICFDVQAIAAFYEATKINPILDPLGSDPSVHVALLFAGLQRYHPELTMDDVAVWFTPRNTVPLVKLLFSALRDQTIDPDAPAVPEAGETENPPSA